MQKQTVQTNKGDVATVASYVFSNGNDTDTIFSHLKTRKCNMVPGWGGAVDAWLCYRGVSGSLQKLSEDLHFKMPFIKSNTLLKE